MSNSFGLVVVTIGICAGAAVGCGSVSGYDAAGGAGGSAGAAGSAGTGGAGGTGGTAGAGGTGGMNQDADTGDVPATSDSGDADTRKCTVKINEVQSGGLDADGGTSALNEFIELYNTCP